MGKSAKESLIQVDNLEYTAYGRNINNRVQHGWRYFIIGLTIINITTCVIACVCAGYCYQKTVASDNVAPPPSLSSPDIDSTTQGYEHENFKEYIVVDPDYMDYYDSDEFDDNYEDIIDDDDDDDDDDNEDYDNEDYDMDGDYDNDDDSEEINDDSLESIESSGDSDKDSENDAGLDIQLPAAHFEASFTDDEVMSSIGSRYDQYGPIKQTLRIFSKADWYDEERTPVTFTNSIATAKSGGIFLVYAQAYIGGLDTTKSIMIVQKRNGDTIQSLRCDNGVNTGNDNIQYQTCSITGLMKLEKSDSLEIQTTNPAEQIMIKKDMTYFGLVQVGEIDSSSNAKSQRRHN
ncbi:Tumor necrosis factor ligand superfamily member 13B [Mactra antiquata]